MKSLFVAASAFAVLLSTATAQIRTSIYVETAANGGIDAAGRGLTIGAPVATLPFAMTLAQTVLSNNQDPVVVIGPGSYTLTGFLDVPAGVELLGREGPTQTTISQATVGQEILRLRPGWNYNTNQVVTSRVFGLNLTHFGGHGIVGYAGRGPGDTVSQSLSARIERCVIENLNSSATPPAWANFGAFQTAGMQFFPSDVGGGSVVLTGVLNTGILIVKDGATSPVYLDLKILDNVIRNSRPEEKVGIWVDSERFGGDRQRSQVINWPATDVAIARNTVESTDTGIYVTSNCVTNPVYGCAPLIARNMLSDCAQAVTIHQRKSIDTSPSQIFFEFTHNTISRNAGLVGVQRVGLLLWGNPAVRRISNNLFGSDNANADIDVGDWYPYRFAQAANQLNMGTNGWNAGVATLAFPLRPVNDGFPGNLLTGPQGVPTFLKQTAPNADLRLVGYINSVMNTNTLLIDRAPTLTNLGEAAIDLDGSSTAIAYQYFGSPIYPNTPTDLGASEKSYVGVFAGQNPFPNQFNVQVHSVSGNTGVWTVLLTDPNHPICAAGNTGPPLWKSQQNFLQAFAVITAGPTSYYSPSFPGITLRSGLLVDPATPGMVLLPLQRHPISDSWELPTAFAGALPPNLPPMEMQIVFDVFYSGQIFTMTANKTVIRTF